MINSSERHLIKQKDECRRQHFSSTLLAQAAGVNGMLWDLISHLEINAIPLNDLGGFFELIFYVSKVKSSLLKVIRSCTCPAVGFLYSLNMPSFLLSQNPCACYPFSWNDWLYLSLLLDFCSLVISTQSPPWPPHLKWPLVFLSALITPFIFALVFWSHHVDFCVYLLTVWLPWNVGWDLLFAYWCMQCLEECWHKVGAISTYWMKVV